MELYLMKKKINNFGEASWIIGNILCAIGNCFAAKSALGLAPIVAPAFVLNAKLGFLSVGFCEYFIQGLLLAICCIVIGKFKRKFIATICNIIFYGACFDILNYLLAFIQPTDLASRILCAVFGTVVTCFAVAMMLRTYIPPSAYEIFVKEIAEAKGFEIKNTKLIFDASMLNLAIALMFLFFGKWRLEYIGVLTVITAFSNSILIAFFGKILDKTVDFSPAIPKLYKILNPKSK
jgi:uncharacterized membrane protein YczE